MTAQIVVDTASPTPPYEQIRAQLAALIRRHELEPGQRLPPVRQLAADLSLAAGTVARAYRELELSGHVVTRRGGGTTVTPALPDGGDGDGWDRSLTDHATAYVAAARRLGATDAELLAAVAAVVHA
jgi:DNA-binding transcriptional regulator YhcF (GntR family)